MKNIASIAAMGLLAAMSGASGFGANVSEAPGLSQGVQRSLDKQAQNPIKAEARTMRAMLGGGIVSAYGKRRRAGYGWTNRHAQRIALKMRNQARHRRSSK